MSTTDNAARCIYHLARARLLIDALAETDAKRARCLRIVAAELDQAASVLQGTATQRYWQRHAPAVEFGDGLKTV